MITLIGFAWCNSLQTTRGPEFYPQSGAEQIASINKTYKTV